MGVGSSYNTRRSPGRLGDFLLAAGCACRSTLAWRTLAVMLHEPRRTSGARWVDRVRGACQNYVVRKLYNNAEKAIFADSLETIEWLPRDESKAVCIPIGSNISEADPVAIQASNSTMH